MPRKPRPFPAAGVFAFRGPGLFPGPWREGQARARNVAQPSCGTKPPRFKYTNLALGFYASDGPARGPKGEVSPLKHAVFVGKCLRNKLPAPAAPAPALRRCRHPKQPGPRAPPGPPWGVDRGSVQIPRMDNPPAHTARVWTALRVRGLTTLRLTPSAWTTRCVDHTPVAPLGSDSGRRNG